MPFDNGEPAAYGICRSGYVKTMSGMAVFFAVVAMAVVILFVKKSSSPVDYCVLKSGIWAAIIGALFGALLAFLCRNVKGMQ